MYNLFIDNSLSRLNQIIFSSFTTLNNFFIADRSHQLCFKTQRYKTHSKEKDQGLLTATLPRRDSPVPVAYIFPRRCSRPSEGETNVRKSPDSGRFSVVFPFMVIKR